jgi:hypothetical protein
MEGKDHHRRLYGEEWIHSGEAVTAHDQRRVLIGAIRANYANLALIAEMKSRLF